MKHIYGLLHPRLYLEGPEPMDEDMESALRGDKDYSNFSCNEVDEND